MISILLHLFIDVWNYNYTVYDMDDKVKMSSLVLCWINTFVFISVIQKD